ncbi:MAG: hypothetical protein EBR07_01970, partial [Planctomycetes bacterium]|nr:hypothetical protein [Planctomycetota bacterium]
MGLVSTHQLSTFTTPVNGTSPIDANQVKGNDNSIKTSYNAHDADTTIHLQSGAVATRPAASTAGQTWLATDSGAVYLWLDNGSAWVEANYLRSTGGTVTGNVSITGTLGVTGATTLSSTLTIGGVTYTFPASQGANQYLKTDGSGNLSWVTFLETLALTDLSDVTITSATSGQFLLYNGTVWVNGTNGSALTTLNASNLSSGTVNTARVAGSYTGITAVGTLTAGAISTGFTAIADTFLATISTAGKVATNANTASAIVARDASGNFTAGTVTAALTGNATTATTLATARAINGVNFDGSAAITVTAAAGTLTGTTLASNVTLSSLTSVGTLSAGAVPASLVTAGTFGAGAYTFPGALAITGALTGVTTGAFSGTVTGQVAGIFGQSLGSATSTIQVHNFFTDKPFIGFYRAGTLRSALYLFTDGDFRLTDSSLAANAGLTMGALSATTGAFSQTVTANVNGGNSLVLAKSNNLPSLLMTGSSGNNFAFAYTASDTIAITKNDQATAILSMTQAGAATFSSTLGVTGLATLSGGVSMDDGDTIQWASANNRVFFNGGAFRVDVNGSQYLGISTAGLVTMPGTLSVTGVVTVAQD